MLVYLVAKMMIILIGSIIGVSKSDDDAVDGENSLPDHIDGEFYLKLTQKAKNFVMILSWINIFMVPLCLWKF